MAITADSITIPFTFERKQPFADDVRYPDALVRHFLKKYTKRGDNVFDPFTGLGTTMFVAEKMGRNPFGIEADAKHHAWTAGQLKHWEQLIHADAAKLSSYGFPKMDFCITSPPFMPRHHKWNPLFAGKAKPGYKNYLAQMGKIFGQVAALMKRKGLVVVQVDNLQNGKIYTPLVRDLGLVVAGALTPVGETVVTWKNGPPGYAHTHCLMFMKE